MSSRIEYKTGDLINGVKFIKEIANYVSPIGNISRKAEFECECGNTFNAIIQNVKKGNSTSCGCRSAKTRTKKYTKGQKINNVEFVRLNGKTGNARKAIFICPFCKTEFTSRIAYVISGHTRSCGCLRIGTVTHGMSNTRIFNIWISMISRCTYDTYYTRYWHGKGIEVCKEWRNDFITFYDWAITNGYSDNLSIDRIDGDKNYTPNNCRWATRDEQGQNTIATKLDPDKVRYIRNIKKESPSKLNTEIAKELDVHPSLIGLVLKRKIWKNID